MKTASLIVRATAVMVVTGNLGVVASEAAVQPDNGVDDRRCGSAVFEIPEFGGAYVAERETDGVPVLNVWMTSPDFAPSDAALATLRQLCPEFEDVVVREADYSYAQLSDWKSLARTVGQVTLIGVDARANRLTVGVADLESDGTEVKHALAQRGVPVDAVVLIEASEPRTLVLPVDHSRSIAFVAAVVFAAALAGTVFWVRRRRRAARAR